MVAARARTRGAESSRVWLAAAITIAIATIWLQRNGECNQDSGVSESRRESLSLSSLWITRDLDTRKGGPPAGYYIIDFLGHSLWCKPYWLCPKLVLKEAL